MLVAMWKHMKAETAHTLAFKQLDLMVGLVAAPGTAHPVSQAFLHRSGAALNCLSLCQLSDANAILQLVSAPAVECWLEFGP